MNGIFQMLSQRPECTNAPEYKSTRKVSRAGQEKSDFDLAREAISRVAVEMYEDLSSTETLRPIASYADISRQYISQFYPDMDMLGDQSGSE